MLTVKKIMKIDSNQSLVDWSEGLNKYGEEKIDRFVIWHWINRNSVPPQHWEAFVKYARDLGSDVSIEQLYNIWVESRKRRVRRKPKKKNPVNVARESI